MSAGTLRRKSEWSSDTILGAILPFAVVAYVVPLIFWHAFVLTKLWNWYLVPGIGAPALHMVFAFGISLIVHFLQSGYHGEDNRETYVKLCNPFLGPLFSLFVGWVGTFWI